MQDATAPVKPVPAAAMGSLAILLLLAIHSCIMFVSFAPLGGPALGWLSAFSLLPLMLVLHTQSNKTKGDAGYMRARWLGLLAYCGALPFWIANQFWIMEVSAPGAPGLMLLETLWTGVFMALAVWTCRKLRWLSPLWAGPILWTAIEFFRGELFGHGYAWSLVGYPMIDYNIIAQPAAIGGIYLVTFWCACISALLAAIAARKLCNITKQSVNTLYCCGLRTPVTLAIVSIIILVAGYLPAANNGEETLRIALVQTNVAQSNKLAWNFEDELIEMDNLEKLTTEAAATTPDVIVWPETMMPGMTLETQALEELGSNGVYYRRRVGSGVEEKVPVTIFAERLKTLSSRVKIPMLVGEDAKVNLRVNVTKEEVEIDQAARYNSVYYYVEGEQQAQRYDKERLTPFGETMPYISSYPSLEKALLDIGAPGMSFDLDEGNNRIAFPIASSSTQFRAVTPICFEITVGPYVRQLVYANGERRADVIINVTNDGWFGSYNSTRVQHLQIARWRCIELGTPMARVANTGISAFIDSRGKVISRVDPMVQVVHTGSIKRPDGSTLYGRLGDWFPWSMLACCIGSTLWALCGSLLRRFFGRPNIMN